MTVARLLAAGPGRTSGPFEYANTGRNVYIRRQETR